MLASDILVDVKRYGFDDLDNAEFLTVLNYVTNDFYNVESWPFLEKLVTANSVVGNGQLFGSTLDLKQALSLINTTQGYSLTPYRTDQFYKEYASMLTTTGNPTIYYLTTVDAAAPNGYNLFSWPIPNTIDAYQLRYLYLPPDLTISDTPVMPSRYHRILTFGCLVELYEQEDDLDAALRMQGKYDRALARMRDDLWAKDFDRQDFVADVTEQDGGHLDMPGWY